MSEQESTPRVPERCTYCGEVEQIVGYDEHHRTPIVTCGCCAPIPDEARPRWWRR